MFYVLQLDDVEIRFAKQCTNVRNKTWIRAMKKLYVSAYPAFNLLMKYVYDEDTCVIHMLSGAAKKLYYTTFERESYPGLKCGISVDVYPTANFAYCSITDEGVYVSSSFISPFPNFAEVKKYYRALPEQKIWNKVKRGYYRTSRNDTRTRATKMIHRLLSRLHADGRVTFELLNFVRKYCRCYMSGMHFISSDFDRLFERWDYNRHSPYLEDLYIQNTCKDYVKKICLDTGETVCILVLTHCDPCLLCDCNEFKRYREERIPLKPMLQRALKVKNNARHVIVNSLGIVISDDLSPVTETSENYVKFQNSVFAASANSNRSLFL